MDEVLRADLLKRAQEWYRKWENTPIPAFKGDICSSKNKGESKKSGLTKNIETKIYYTTDKNDIEAAKNVWEFVKLKIGDKWESFTEAWDKWCHRNCTTIVLFSSTFIPNAEISTYSYYDMAWNPTKLYSQGSIENEFIPFLSLPSDISSYVYIPMLSLYVILV